MNEINTNHATHLDVYAKTSDSVFSGGLIGYTMIFDGNAPALNP